MADLKLTALDGGQVSASGPDIPATAAGCTSVAVFSVGNRLHQFVAGDSRFSRMQADSLGVTEKAQYRMHGGRVRISTGDQDAPGGVISSMHVAWEGRAHTLATVMYHTDTAPALALLDAIEIEERDDGIVLRARDDRFSIVQDSQHAPVVMIPIRGEGLLDAFRASRYWDRKRPAWSGKAARGGDLYAESHQDHDGQESNSSMLLFGRSAVTRIYLNDKRNGLANRAADLAVDWA